MDEQDRSDLTYNQFIKISEPSSDPCLECRDKRESKGCRIGVMKCEEWKNFMRKFMEDK